MSDTDGSGSHAHLTGDRPAAATTAALTDRNELAAIAVERTRMPMVVSDPRLPDNPIILANKAFFDLSGYTSEEVIGYNCRFLQGPDTDPRAIDEIRKAIANESELTIEILNYRKNGQPFWNQFHISPIYDDNGALLYFFASQLDVSEVRKVGDLERVEHMLMREVDHRARNALALVQGIVRLTRADNAADYAAAVQGRVDALAHAHAILADARWREVSLARLIHSEVQPFGPRRVSLDGPPLEIPPEQVQPLALLLHEIVANAAQHGALSTPDGTMAINWSQVDGRVTIVMREIGGPVPAPVRKPGFGSTIVDSIVRRQLRGDATFDWRPEGLNSTVMIPVAT